MSFSNALFRSVIRAAFPTVVATLPAAAAADVQAPASSAVADGGSGASDDVIWTLRDRDLDEASTLSGGSGLLRTQHAETGAPGQFRLGFVGEWFSASFLCTSAYPCPTLGAGASGASGGLLTGDTTNHIGATLSLGVSVAKLGPGTLEAYAATQTYANSDTANEPSLLQVLGDTDLGLKYALPLGDVLRLGLHTDLLFVNGLGTVGLSGDGTSARLGGIATADFRGLRSAAPLRASVNLDYTFDNTAQVVSDVEAARGAPITRIERFGLGINRVDRVDVLLGVEGMLADERIHPFVEFRLSIPNNRQGYVCSPSNPNRDSCLGNDVVTPAVLTLGGRFFPWRRGFSVLAALDIGLSGMSTFVEEVQPTPPWMLYLGGGWAIDTWDRPHPVKVVEKASALLTRVVGFVHEKDKNAPVPGALVSYRERPDLMPLSTNEGGRFGDDVRPGPYTYVIRAEGYKEGTCQATVPEPDEGSTPRANTAADPHGSAEPDQDGAEVDIDCPLEALSRLGVVTGHVRDADTSDALARLTVVLTDPQHKDLRALTDAVGGFRFEGVPGGTAQLSLVADGYLALVTPAEVKPQKETTVDLLLRPKPKNPEVLLTAKEITIRNQVQFALDSAVILPQSFGLLTEVADTMLRHPEVLKIEVQGHTDNSGTAEHNQALSDERAQSVRAWLLAHGVSAERLVAKGYGQDQPLVPNVTATNRAQNRRVQFIILVRGAAEVRPAAPSPPPNLSTSAGSAGGKAPAAQPPPSSAAPPPASTLPGF